MSFIPRLAVAAVAGTMLATGAATASFAQTPTPTPEATATATSTATATASPTPSATPSATATTTPTPTGSATPAPPPAPIPSPTLVKFEGPNFTMQGCDLRVEYAIDPAVRVELFRKVNDGEFEQQYHPNWYWTDTHEPGDVVTWKLKRGDDERQNTITIPADCANSTPTPTPTATPTPTTSPTATPRALVTATYECGAVTFTNPLDKSVLIHYGTAQTDDLEGSLHLDAGKSETVQSTNKAFGWTAWPEGDQTKDDVGHLWLPGEDLSCDEPDDSATPTPTPTPKPGESRGLANTGSEGTTSVTIVINGTRIEVTAPGNGKPIITTNGETVEPTPTGKATPTPSPSATPSATPTPGATPAVPAGDDDQGDEIAEQQGEQDAPADDEQAVADRIFELTNQFREKEGLAPFERSECLDKTADGHAVTMATTGYRHATQEEMQTMAKSCPGFEGENIATGYEDAAEVFHAWETSTDGHREAMLSKTETVMGVGVEYDDTGKPFYVQHFGGQPVTADTK